MTAPATKHAEHRRLAYPEVLDLLEGVRVIRDGHAVALCPAHGDRSPSLAVDAGEDGKILIACRTGCSFKEVVAALGLEPWQLFPARPGGWRPRLMRPDADAEARELLLRLAALREALPEGALARVGRVLLGGTLRYADTDRELAGLAITTSPFPMLLAAVRELVVQATPRRWFSPLALAREIDRWGGKGFARGAGVFFWCGQAVARARWEGA